MEAGLAPGWCRETQGARLLLWSALCAVGGGSVNWHTQRLTGRKRSSRLHGSPFPQQYGNTHLPVGCGSRHPTHAPRRSGGPLGAVGSRGGRALPPHTCGLSPALATAGSLGDHSASRHRGYRCHLPAWTLARGCSPCPGTERRVPASMQAQSSRHRFKCPSPTFCQEHRPAPH